MATQILAQTIDNLVINGDDTAAALALGDAWVALASDDQRKNVAKMLRKVTRHTARRIWPAFADMMKHGETEAAALALGDAWLTLPPADRQQIVSVINAH